jgi:hypothetical protein
MAGIKDLGSALGVVKDFAKYSKESGQSWSDIAQSAKSFMGGGGGNMGGTGVVANPGSFGNYRSGNGGFGSGLVNLGLGAAGAVASMLPSPAQAAAYQLSTSRQGFFGNQSFTSVASAQRGMASAGTGIDSMDAVRAITTLQNAGIYNTGAIGKGVAALSNYEPGMGLAGTAQAIGSMNQGRSVNMLNAIGVQVRGANGLMRDPNQIVNDFVDKIFQSTPPLRGGAADAYAYLIGWLQPGNQGYLILNTYFTDSNMRQLVVDKLFARAKGLPGTPSKDQLISAGAMTKTTAAQSANNAANLGLVQGTQADINRGTTAALNGLTKATDMFTKEAEKLHSVLYGVGFASTMMGSPMGAAGAGLAGAAGGLVSGLLGKLPGIAKGLFNIVKSPRGILTALGLVADEAAGAAGAVETGGASEIAAQAGAAGLIATLSKIYKGKAAGGPVNDKVPYIVGEKGPELFVPQSNGTIIPNHVIGRAGGGSVDAGGFASMLLGRLGAPQTAQNMANLTMWEGMEGGNWHNTANYNPLNTSYQLGGSVNYSTRKSGSGVQAYGSWDDGLNATVNTLTGSQADSRGYTNIVKLLKSGNATKGDFLKALQGSAWDAGGYRGGSSSSVADSSAGGIYSSSNSSPMSGFGGAAPGTVLGSVGGSGGGGNTVNVYVTVPAATDPKHIAATTKAITDAVSKATGVRTDRTK